MDEAYLGEIRLFAGNYAPVGWAICDGSVLQATQNPALFAILGGQYGGDGRTTFALPDLRGKVAVGAGLNYAIGSKGGQESVALTQLQMPTHNHGVFVDAGPAGATEPNPANNYLSTSQADIGGAVPVSTYSPTLTTEGKMLNPTSLTMCGGDQAHENRMPYVTINYIICTSGVYPMRS